MTGCLCELVWCSKTRGPRDRITCVSLNHCFGCKSSDRWHGRTNWFWQFYSKSTQAKIYTWRRSNQPANRRHRPIDAIKTWSVRIFILSTTVWSTDSKCSVWNLKTNLVKIKCLWNIARKYQQSDFTIYWQSRNLWVSEFWWETKYSSSMRRSSSCSSSRQKFCSPDSIFVFIFVVEILRILCRRLLGICGIFVCNSSRVAYLHTVFL